MWSDYCDLSLSQGCLDVLVNKLKLVVDCVLAVVMIAAILQVM